MDEPDCPIGWDAERGEPLLPPQNEPHDRIVFPIFTPAPAFEAAAIMLTVLQNERQGNV